MLRSAIDQLHALRPAPRAAAACLLDAARSPAGVEAAAGSDAERAALAGALGGAFGASSAKALRAALRTTGWALLVGHAGGGAAGGGGAGGGEGDAWPLGTAAHARVSASATAVLGWAPDDGGAAAYACSLASDATPSPSPPRGRSGSVGSVRSGARGGGSGAAGGGGGCATLHAPVPGWPASSVGSAVLVIIPLVANRKLLGLLAFWLPPHAPLPLPPSTEALLKRLAGSVGAALSLRRERDEAESQRRSLSNALSLAADVFPAKHAGARVSRSIFHALKQLVAHSTFLRCSRAIRPAQPRSWRGGSTSRACARAATASSGRSCRWTAFTNRRTTLRMPTATRGWCRPTATPRAWATS